MNDALIAAQQLRAEAKQAAEREAEAVIREARAEGERIVDRARMDERQVRERAETAARQFAAYVAAFRALLERQMAELDVLEGHTKTIIQVQSEALAASTRDRGIMTTAAPTLGAQMATAVAAIRRRSAFVPEVGMILGTGLGALGKSIDDRGRDSRTPTSRAFPRAPSSRMRASCCSARSRAGAWPRCRAAFIATRATRCSR